MATSLAHTLSALLVGLITFSSAHAADRMSKDDYRAAKDRISADYQAAKQACDGQTGQRRAVCEKEARARQKVARAELDYDNSGKESDRVKRENVKAEQQYAVAKERCGERQGAEKSACKKDAKAAEVKAKADIRRVKKVAG
jgi:hypothetical protein